jgi:hypothetical protein
MRIAALVVVVVCGRAFADVSAPESHAIKTPNGRLQLVLLVKDGHAPRPGSPAAELNAKYTRSGLYRTDGSTDPLWTVDWYSRTQGIYPLSDGHTLVVVHFEEPNCYPVEWTLKANGRTVPELARDTTVVTFYRDGKPFRTYTGGELFDVSRFEAGMSWWGSSDAPDEEWGTIKLRTNTGEVVELDIRSGAIVDGSEFIFCGTPDAERRQLVWLAGGAVAIGGTVVFLGLAYFLLRRQKVVL